MRRILLTGGAGFVGLNVAELLLSSGFDVAVFDKNELPLTAFAEFRKLPGSVEVINADIRDEHLLMQAAGDADAIIHATAITPGSAHESELATLAVEVNISGTINAVRAARKARSRRMVFLGSASVYGENDGSAKSLDERLVAASPRGIYSVTKFAAERIAERLAVKEEIDLRCVRIGSVFGPWEYPSGVRHTLSAILQATAAAYRGIECVLPRAGRRDWIYSRDAARAILHVLRQDGASGEPVNIALGQEWSVADWCDRLSRRYPNFRYRIGSADEPSSIDYHGSGDRAPLATKRLREEFGFSPEYDLDHAFDDYMRWITTHDEFLKGWRDAGV